MTTPTAEAAAVGVRCRDVQAGGYRATHVFADFMPCYSVRDKLRRWLGRGRLPRKENGWYCSHLGGTGSVRACANPGERGSDQAFTFWLRHVPQAQAAAPARECPKGVAEGGSAVTLRAVHIVVGSGAPCRGARLLIRRYMRDALDYGNCYALDGQGRSTCRVGGWTFSTRYDADYRLLVRARRGERAFRFVRNDTPHG